MTISSLSVFLRDQSDRRISWLRTGLIPLPLSVILRSHRPKNLNEWLRINSAKNLVFVFRINSVKQFEERNVCSLYGIRILKLIIINNAGRIL